MEDRIEQAVRHIELGDKMAAMKLLAQVIKEEPENEEAWIWMAEVVDDPVKKEQCLEKVLQINPENQDAQDALFRLRNRERLRQEPGDFFEREPVMAKTPPFAGISEEGEALSPDLDETAPETEMESQESPKVGSYDRAPAAAYPGAVASRKRPKRQMGLSPTEKRILIVLVVLTVIVVLAAWGYIISTLI